MLKEEISELEQQLAKKKQELAHKKEADIHDRELIKEIVKEKVCVLPPLQKAPTTPLPIKKAVIKKTKELKGEKKERQIQLLTELAFEKGVIHATEVARKLDDAHILDEFHDNLVDELYKNLVEQGKLKQI